VSDIDTVVVDSLKALDPDRPIREADIVPHGRHISPDGRSSAAMAAAAAGNLQEISIETGAGLQAFRLACC
jgi:hypothetical protein